MNNEYNTPTTIWLDRRVLRTFNTDRDPNIESDQVGYISLEAAREREQKAVQELESRIPEEFVIQLQTVADKVLALTNYGRIFEEVEPGIWAPYRGPEL